MNIPDKIFGLNSKPQRDIIPKVLHNFLIESNSKQNIEITIYRWEINDFVIDGLNLKDGHFLSFEIKHDNNAFDLFQNKSIFYSNSKSIMIDSIDPIKNEKYKSIFAPKWHKCDRYWPSIKGTPFEFVTQFYFDDNVAYLFKFETDEGILFAIFKDNMNRQDMEEHYKLEEELGL